MKTRRSNGGGIVDTTTFGGILKSFSNINTTKTIIKKIKPNVAQLLLAHGFQKLDSSSIARDRESLLMEFFGEESYQRLVSMKLAEKMKKLIGKEHARVKR